MKLYLAKIGRMLANDRMEVRGNIEIFTDDDVTLDEVIDDYCKKNDQKIGETNRFGATLLDIVESEVDLDGRDIGKIFINDSLGR